MENATVNILELSNPLQYIWDLRVGYEDYLRSPLFPIVLSVSVYLISILPFTIVDLFGRNWTWIQKYKIQPEKTVTLPLLGKAVRLTVRNHVLYILPISIAQWIWTPPTPLPPQAPGVFEFVWQLVVMLVIFDFQYYVWHWAHHKNRWLYRTFHAFHHQYNSPFSWVTQYLHPWELFTVGFFTTVNPLVFNCHCMTNWSWMLMNVFISIEAHHGFDFPLAAHNWIPFKLYGGAIKHDMHHMKPLTNFQPYLNTWDRLFGTYCPATQAGGHKPKELIEYEERQKQEKRAKHAVQNGDTKKDS